ncbi:hypothetical protein PoB_001091100 [Plakobranchus ocellatus]|uniref:BRCT domain-containing protein n=1 Tax=Plakobranchus ocellatus TaxID=259542 RepID=A0AAV3YMA2_9GAST|nr:hypothetical protein PoB_001091100 [Plakobranchus ocellatus]
MISSIRRPHYGRVRVIDEALNELVSLGLMKVTLDRVSHQFATRVRVEKEEASMPNDSGNTEPHSYFTDSNRNEPEGLEVWNDDKNFTLGKQRPKLYLFVLTPGKGQEANSLEPRNECQQQWQAKVLYYIIDNIPRKALVRSIFTIVNLNRLNKCKLCEKQDPVGQRSPTIQRSQACYRLEAIGADEMTHKIQRGKKGMMAILKPHWILESSGRERPKEWPGYPGYIL